MHVAANTGTACSHAENTIHGGLRRHFFSTMCPTMFNNPHCITDQLNIHGMNIFPFCQQSRHQTEPWCARVQCAAPMTSACFYCSPCITSACRCVPEGHLMNSVGGYNSINHCGEDDTQRWSTCGPAICNWCVLDPVALQRGWLDYCEDDRTG